MRITKRGLIAFQIIGLNYNKRHGKALFLKEYSSSFLKGETSPIYLGIIKYEKNKFLKKRIKGYPKIHRIHFMIEEIPSQDIEILTDKLFFVFNNNEAFCLGKKVKQRGIKK